MPEQHSFDFIVIGGGLVGLATARALLLRQPGARLAVLEKESSWAQHQSGRNSGVLHSGIYYPKGSLKARLTISGRRRLIEYCEERSLPFDRCGKVILASHEDEIVRLKALDERGRENGLRVELVDAHALAEIEPHARAAAALWVPETGIVDFKAMAGAIAGELGERGAELVLGAKVLGIAAGESEPRIRTNLGEFRAGAIVNCGGLQCDRIARMAGLKPDLRIIPFRGEYFRLRGKARDLVRGLIYPLADPQFPFLGVHLTRTIAGEVLAGPNAVLSYRREGYSSPAFNLRDSVETLSYPGFWRLASHNLGRGLGEMLRRWNVKAFARDLKKLVPEIGAGDLAPARAGVRAQAVDRQGQLVKDFYFLRGPKSLHVLNAPSPAATASLAIGDYVAGELLEHMEP